ncbi:MAG TPA: hypothetical protein VMQ67_13175 [Candidatus Saccharimonadales bacterium]|nr:hypothetical protein [Candidatus Saccharimonadales bacterium]
MENKLRVISATLSILASMASVANATLVDSGDIMQDTSTGLQWLDLNQTAGLSYNYVAGQLGLGGAYAGYSFATESQVNQLFADAGIPNVNVGSGGTVANVPGVTSLMSSWNANIAGIYTSGSGPFGYFFTAGVGTGLLWLPLSGTAEATSGPDRLGVGGDGYSSVSYLGSALVETSVVTPVPEPTTIISGALLLLPFGSSAFRQLRKKLQAA